MKKHFRKLLMLLSLSGALLSSCSQDGDRDTYIVQQSDDKEQLLVTETGQTILFTKQDQSSAQALKAHLETETPIIDRTLNKSSAPVTFIIVSDVGRWKAEICQNTKDQGLYIAIQRGQLLYIYLASPDIYISRFSDSDNGEVA